MRFSALLLAAALLSAAAQAVPVESLGRPCTPIHYLGGAAVRDTAENVDYVVMSTASEAEPAGLLFINPGNDDVRPVQAPSGSGAWAIAQIPGTNQVAVGAYFNGHVLVFDMTEGRFVKEIPVEGQACIWNFAAGRDGRLYFGTYPGGLLCALNPADLSVEVLGPGAPPNTSLRRVSVLPDGRLLCAYDKEAPAVRLFNPEDKTFSDPPDSLKGVFGGVVWNGLFAAGNRFFDAALAEVKPPFPVPSSDTEPWAVIEEATTESVLWSRRGDTYFRAQAGESVLAPVADIALRGGRFVAGLPSGDAFGVRGCDYFTFGPGNVSMLRKPVRVKGTPRPPLFLAADSEMSQIWGAPLFGPSLFVMTPDSKAYTVTDKAVDAEGAVNALVIVKGMVYGVCHAQGDIFRLDPNLPWEQYERKNPVTIASLGVRGYTHPRGGLLMGHDGKLYSGWAAKPGTAGGAVAVTDPETGETELVENPFGRQAVSGLAMDESLIYVGTSVEPAGKPGEKGPAPQLGVMGVDTRQPYKNFPFEGSAGVTCLGRNPALPRLAFAVDNAFRMLDTASLELLPPPETPYPPVTGGAIIAAGSPYFFYPSGAFIIRVDAATGTFETIAELPGQIGAFTGFFAGDLFAACGNEVYGIDITP
ncbi:MAG: hypothetical protein GXY15_15130 [Candidatus Hydrogenedentes bacterium]|nr:hypothetical protein [Candidatus Hydrogenedentota bacterium]